ncbi:transcription termination factor 1-like [Branchiostoma lanceolatum]|uniref:transcription termination factor 1-like n=1 Tax=Branchiostoma lanceolatum TaxID=7740 RepID=UPI003455C5EB
MDTTLTSPSKKRKRLDSHGSLADTSDLGSAYGDYTRDSHDIIVTKSRKYKKKQMMKLAPKSSAETSAIDADGKKGENKNTDNEASTVSLSGQSKNGNVVNGSSVVTSSSSNSSLPTSPAKGSSSVLLRRQYRRERTSSQSSTGTDHASTSLSQIDYFPLSGQEKKKTTTEEDRSVAPKHTTSTLQTTSAKTSASDVFPWISSSQESGKESQPPIRLDADGLLVQEDIFKKPLGPVESSPSKFSIGLVSKSGKRKKKHREKGGMSDDTSGVETDTGASVSTVQSAQEDVESGNEKRHKKKKKKKKEKDKDAKSDALENQATGVSTMQSVDDNAGESDEKRHKKKKKKKEKEKDRESDALESQATSVSTTQFADDNAEESDEKRHKKKKKKKKEKDRDIEDSSAAQPASVSTAQSEHDNVEGDEEKRHKKKRKKDKEPSTLEGQVSEAENSDVIPPTQELSKPEKSKKKHKKRSDGSGLDSEVNGEEVVLRSQDTTLNGNVSSENQSTSNTDTARKKKGKAKDKRSKSASTSQSESEVPESDVGSPIKSPLTVPRRHAIGDDEAKKTGSASKDKSNSKPTANKLPVWCIEDAGQESQTVSEVFDMFGWGQNKPSGSGTRQSSQGVIRTTSTQPNFDSVVGKEGGGTSVERREKDNAFEYQSHDDTAAAITPQKKSKLSRKEKQKSDTGKTVDGEEQQQSSVDDNAGNDTGADDETAVAITPQKKSKLSRKGKRKSDTGKTVDGEKQQQSSANDSAGNSTGTESEPVPNESTREDMAKENTSTESGDNPASKLPSKPAQDNVTERRKGKKKVKTRDVSEEAESTVDKADTTKRRKIESKRRQQDRREKENPTGEENEEVNPEEQTQDQAIETHEDQDGHSSGDDFQDLAASPSTSRATRSSSRKRRSVGNNDVDSEDLWLKGVQALSAEDVKSLKERGVTIRFGHFSRQEKAILTKNMESFCKEYGVKDSRTLLFPNQYDHRRALKKLIQESGMFRHLAQGLNRPLWNVYTKARYMFSNPEISGRWSPKEDRKLMKLYEKYGPRWALISKYLGRFEDNIKQRFRQRSKNKGKWAPEESKKLIQAVQAVTGQQDVTNLTCAISWQECSHFMDNMRSATQCRVHWLSLVNWFSFQQGEPMWNPQRDLQLIDEIYQSEAEATYDIDWRAIAGKLSWVKHHSQVSKRWHSLRLRVTDWERKDLDDILDYLKEDRNKQVKKWKRLGKSFSPREAKGSPFVFTSSEESSEDSLDDEDDEGDAEEDNDIDGTIDNDRPTPTADNESSDVDNSGKTGHNNKSDEDSSEEEDTDDDSETEVNTSNEG